MYIFPSFKTRIVPVAIDLASIMPNPYTSSSEERPRRRRNLVAPRMYGAVQGVRLFVPRVCVPGVVVARPTNTLSCSARFRVASQRETLQGEWRRAGMTTTHPSVLTRCVGLISHVQVAAAAGESPNSTVSPTPPGKQQREALSNWSLYHAWPRA